MNLNVSFIELHKEISKLKDSKVFTLDEAFDLGCESASNPNSDNCHFSLFEKFDTSDAWEKGRLSILNKCNS